MGPVTCGNFANGQEWLWTLGAMANRLFLGAYVAALLRFHFAATIATALGLLCAVLCLVPGQVADIWGGGDWVICFGYFIWCAAHCVLFVAEQIALRSRLVISV